MIPKELVDAKQGSIAKEDKATVKDKDCQCCDCDENDVFGCHAFSFLVGVPILIQ
jgi:hypothetical protein